MRARNRLISVLAISICTAAAAARAQGTWARVLGHWGYFVTGARSASTSDGGCVVVGTVPSFGANRTDGLIVKMRADGKIQWQKMLGGRWWDSFRDVLQTADGEYVAVGVHSPTSDTQGLWCARFDAGGTVLWQRIFEYTNGGDNDYWSDPIIREAADGGVLVASVGTVVRLGADGDVVWVRSFSADNRSDIEDLRLTQDGGSVLLLDSLNAGAIVKLDSAGIIEWSRNYKGRGFGFGGFGRFLLLADGGYLLVGANIHGAAALSKVDSEGNVIWGYSYDGFFLLSWDTGVCESVDGSVRIGSSTPAIMAVDAAGQFLWGKEYSVRYSGQNSVDSVTLQPSSAGGMLFSLSRRKADFHLELEANIVALRIAADGSIDSCPDLVQNLMTIRKDLKVAAVPVTTSSTDRTLVVATPDTTTWKSGLLAKDLCENAEE